METHGKLLKYLDKGNYLYQYDQSVFVLQWKSALIQITVDPITGHLENVKAITISIENQGLQRIKA